MKTCMYGILTFTDLSNQLVSFLLITTSCVTSVSWLIDKLSTLSGAAEPFWVDFKLQYKLRDRHDVARAND